MTRFSSCFLSAAAVVLFLVAPARAQTLGTAYLQSCRAGVSYGGAAAGGCRAGAGGGHAYEQWQDGSTALPGMTASASSTFQYRGFSSVHDYGR